MNIFRMTKCYRAFPSAFFWKHKVQNKVATVSQKCPKSTRKARSTEQIILYQKLFEPKKVLEIDTSKPLGGGEGAEIPGHCSSRRRGRGPSTIVHVFEL